MNKKVILDYLHQKKDWVIMLVLALMGISIIYQGLERQKRIIGLDTNVIQVLIANQTMNEGEPFTQDALVIEQMPEKYVPIGALYPSDAHKFEGQIVTRTINKGEIILSNALDIDFSLDNTSSKIQEGYRALSIPTDELSSVGYTLEPGDHIDLLTSLDLGNQQETTITLLQNVTVLSTGSKYSDQGSYGSITLMVLPSEAPLIMHTLKQYGLSIILRNPYDQDTKTDLPMISRNEIIEAGFLNHIQQQRDQKIKILHGSYLSENQ